MPPKAVRGRKKRAVKQETLDQFVKSNHDEELSTKISKNSNIDKVTNDSTMEIEKNSTNSESTTEQESLQINGVENTESHLESKSKENPDDAKSEASVKNENTTAAEEILEVKENTSKKNVPSKRGRKQKNDLANGDKESISEAPTKRSRRNKPENSNTTDESKEKVDGNIETPKENAEQDKKTRAGRNKKQNNAASAEEAPKVGRKRRNIKQVDAQENKNKSDTNHSDVLDTNTVLKVSIKRDEELDKRSLEETEKIKSAKGGNKPAAKGKRARIDNTSAQDSDEKPAKIPKETSKSKGQSKKDKMPDVTLLDFENTSKCPDGKPWNLKLSSWNVNGVRAWLEKDGLAYLHHESPDVLCVQETKCSDDKLPEEVKVDGYHSYWLAGDKDGYSGVGLLSKVKPISVKYGIGITEHDNEGRVITAEYDNFFLVTAYVPNAGRGLVRLNYRMQWDKDFLSYLKSLDEKKPVVLCGDLNVAHEEIDLANPKTNKKNAGFTKEEREGFSTLLSEGNFIDTFRHLYPDQKAAYTFWTYMMNARAKDVGWRLDYFIMSKRFTDHLCDHVIRKEVFGSDHCPITLFLSV